MGRGKIRAYGVMFLVGSASRTNNAGWVYTVSSGNAHTIGVMIGDQRMERRIVDG